VDKEMLKFEHKQLLDIGKFYYDGVFKFASMSFLLNGVLLSALAFVVKEAGSSSKDFLSEAILLVGSIGIVYNCGVACACISLSAAAWNFTKRFNTVDGQLGLQMADCKSTFANFWGSIGWMFTAIFFVLWVSVWSFLILNRMALIHT
jgi:phage-related protein